MDSQPWYEAGLRFSCTRCGRCCTGEAGYVWVNEDEIFAIAGHLGMASTQVREIYTRSVDIRRTLREKANHDCVFYDPGQGCTIYPVRPRQCRTWPFWESNLKSPAEWEQTCQVCPGAGQGDLISAEEITRRMHVIKL